MAADTSIHIHIGARSKWKTLIITVEQCSNYMWIRMEVDYTDCCPPPCEIQLERDFPKGWLKVEKDVRAEEGGAEPDM